MQIFGIHIPGTSKDDDDVVWDADRYPNQPAIVGYPITPAEKAEMDMIEALTKDGYSCPLTEDDARAVERAETDAMNMAYAAASSTGASVEIHIHHHH